MRVWTAVNTGDIVADGNIMYLARTPTKYSEFLSTYHKKLYSEHPVFVANYKVSCKQAICGALHVGLKSLVEVSHLLKYVNMDTRDAVIIETSVDSRDMGNVIYNGEDTQYKLSGVTTRNIESYNISTAILLDSISLKRVLCTYHISYLCVQNGRVLYKLIPEKRNAGLISDTIVFDMSGNVYVFDGDEPKELNPEAIQMALGMSHCDVDMTPQSVLDCCNGKVIIKYMEMIQSNTNLNEDMADVNLYKIMGW